MTDVTNPRFDYLGRFTVELGPQGDTEYQFGKLLSAVAQLTENDRGTIDLSLEGARPCSAVKSKIFGQFFRL